VDLISEYSDGCCGRYFVNSEPHSRQSSRDPQNEDLGDGTDSLSEEEQPVPVWTDRAAFDPCPGSVKEASEDGRQPQTPSIEQPRGREDQRDVSDHVDHRQHVDCHALAEVSIRKTGVVVDLDLVADDNQMEPLVSV